MAICDVVFGEVRMRGSPVRMVVGMLLSWLVAVGAGLLTRMARDHGNEPARWGALALMAAGMVGVYWLGSRLRRGVLEKRWAAGQVAPLRAMVEHPAWRYGMTLLLVLLCATLLLPRAPFGYFWSLFLLQAVMTLISQAFTPPKQRTGGGGQVDWSGMRAVESAHWGERRTGD